MISNPHASVTSVTSDPLCFLGDAIAQLQVESAPEIDKVQSPFCESMRQKRLDKSASNLSVRKLLSTAAAGGMTKKDFELSGIGVFPPRKNDVDSKIERAQGFKGSFWHYYMTGEARMSLRTLIEYAAVFYNKGWLTEDQVKNVSAYASEKLNALASVKKMFPSDSAPDYDLERSVRTLRHGRNERSIID